jgi:hypothetical protein
MPLEAPLLDHTGALLGVTEVYADPSKLHPYLYLPAGTKSPIRSTRSGLGHHVLT